MTTRIHHGGVAGWSRLVIVDPGLTDSIGHHLGYSLAVALAARDAGLPAEILAGRDFVADCLPVPIAPVFSARYQSATEPSRMRGALYGLASKLPPRAGHAVAQGLRSARRAVKRAGAGAEDKLGSELATALAAMPDAAGALVLLHSVSAANLAALPEAITPASLGGLAVVLRRTPEEMDTTDAAAVSITVIMRRLADRLGDRMRVFADTDDLSIRYRLLLDLDVVTAPLPVVTPPIRSVPVGSSPHLVFAGGARAEKGYHHLHTLIERFRGRARFTIHSGVVTDNADPLVQRAHRALRACTGETVALIEHSLSPDAYLALIGSADLLLLPYDGPVYGPRSSGILAEARAMGVPAIVPDGCWMAREAGPARSLIFGGAADIGDVVEAALADLPALSALYRDSAQAWRARHNPGRLFDALANWDTSGRV